MRKELKTVLIGVLIAYLMVALAFVPLTSPSGRASSTVPMAPAKTRGTSIDYFCDGHDCKKPNPNAEAMYTSLGLDGPGPAPMTTGSRAVNKYAVLAGVSDYPGTGMDLQQCHWDVYHMRDKMIQLGWSSANIHILLNETATQANILNEIAWMKGKEDASSQTWFHYSGHGNSGYFLVYDTQMTDDTLANAFTGFESTQQVIVMDTCFAGSFTALNRANTIGMMACSNNEYSFDGMFTPNYVAALKDSTVSVEKAFATAKTSTSTDSGGNQNPIMWDNVAGDMFIGDKAPTIGSVPDFSTQEDTPIIMTLTPYESDEEDSGTSLDWYVSNYDPSAIATKMGERSDNDTLILSPQLNYYGTSSLELTLIDGVGLKDKLTIMVTWTPINDAPTVASLDKSKPSTLRTQPITFKLYGNDVDNLPIQITTEFEVSVTGMDQWTAISGAKYNQGHWEVEWTPDKDSTVGAYDVRGRLKDQQGDYSAWITRTALITVRNNLPTVTGILVPTANVERTKNTTVSVFGADVEDSTLALSAELELKAPNGDFKLVGGGGIVAGHWDISYIPLVDAPLGWYDMRARLKDNDGDYGPYFYKNNSLEIKNCRPTVMDIIPDQFSVMRDTSVSLLLTGYDAEDLNKDLVLELQVAAPDGQWANMNEGINFAADQWAITFSPESDAVLGNYSFRARLIDSIEAEGDWFVMNGTIDVQNNLPVVTSVQIDPTSVIRTQTITVFVEGNDVEDLRSTLTVEPQMSLHGKDSWGPKGIGTIEWLESKGAFSVQIAPDAHFIPGTYDLRIRLIDSDGETGQWFTSPKQIEVQNGPAVIDLVVPTLINEGELATFDATRSKDPEGGSLQFTWEFGDGTVGEGPTPGHIYKTFGHYPLKLKVRDIDGLEVTKEVSLNVNGLPTAGVVGLQDTGFNNFNVKFDTSTAKDPEGSAITYKWDFDLEKDSNGDGNPANDVDSTEANPSFNYGKTGEYDYKVTITDSQGGSTVKTGKVTISSMSSFTIGLLVLLVVLIAVIAVAAVVLMRRKKKGPAVAISVARPIDSTRSLLDYDDL